MSTTMKNSRHRNCSACNNHNDSRNQQHQLSQSKSKSKSKSKNQSLSGSQSHLQSQQQSKSHIKSRYQSKEEEQQIRLELSRNSSKKNNSKEKSIKNFKKYGGDPNNKILARKTALDKQNKLLIENRPSILNTKTKSTKKFKNSTKKCLNIDCIDYSHNNSNNQNKKIKHKLGQSHCQSGKNNISKSRLCNRCQKCQNCGKVFSGHQSINNSRKKIENSIGEQQKKKLLKYIQQSNSKQTPPLSHPQSHPQFLSSSPLTRSHSPSPSPLLFPSSAQQHNQQYLNTMLDNYESILKERIMNLRSKWSQLQILEKSISGSGYQQNHNIDRNGNDGSNYMQILKVQNQFYVQKITNLQKQIKDKDIKIEQLTQNKSNTLTNNNSIGNNNSKEREAIQKQLRNQNKKIKQENGLLQKENKVLKNKLKELGFL